MPSWRELQFVRHFNWPHAIPPEEPVWLQVVACIRWEGLQLNGQSISGRDELIGDLLVTRFSVDQHLKPRNQIVLCPAMDRHEATNLEIVEVCLLIG